MREIKFRQWSGTKMDYRPKTGVGGGACINDLFDVYGYEIDNILTQFTGLKDKNGKEIYEGDILTIRAGHPYWLDKKFEVVFYEGAFCMKPKVIGLLDKPVSFIYYGDMALKNGYEEDFGIYIEVIGNIYQNPELLKD